MRGTVLAGCVWLLFVSAALAGCAAPDEPAPAVQVFSEAEASDRLVEHGNVVGVVVDAAIRPVSGATVTVPGLERSVKSDEGGHFGFSQVPPGALFVRVAHPLFQTAAAEGQVVAGETTRLQVVLESVPDQEPFIELFAFNGFASVTDPFALMACEACTWQFDMAPDPDAVVVEMVSERVKELGPNFWWEMRSGVDVHADAYGRDPGRIAWVDDQVPPHPAITLTVKPSHLHPEVDVAFDVFVAGFHNGADPEAWTMLGGSG